MLILDQEHRDAYTRAIAWARRNPDKVIAGDLAFDSERGRLVQPLDPRADCFCVLGRIAKELGVNVDGTDDAVALVDDDVSMDCDFESFGDRLWSANDDGTYNNTNRLAGFDLLEQEMKK